MAMSNVVRDVVALSALVLFMATSAPAADDALATHIDAHLQRWHEADRFHGAALVALDGEVVLEKGYGMANREWSAANTPATRFKLQSISKQFTTVLIFQLAAEGALNLDDAIITHLPEYRADTGSVVTIDHLLRHTSGIPCYVINGTPRNPNRAVFNWGDTFERDDLIATYMSGNLQFEPGSEYRYCNTGYFLLASIIERVMGETFEQVLKERILEPVGLKNTGIDYHERMIAQRAEGYVRSVRGWGRPPFERQQNLLGAGNLYATVGDVYRWNLALSGDALLPATWREKMFTVYSQQPGEAHAYSVNWYAMQLDNDEIVRYRGFSGGAAGFMTDAFTFEDIGLTVVLFDNSGQYNHWRIAPELYAIARGGNVPHPLPLAGPCLAHRAHEDGLIAAVAQYESMRNLAEQTFDMGSIERTLNLMGYQSIAMDHYDDALEVLTLNTKLFPDAWNTWDSLAYAYEHAGDLEQSATLYAKAHAMRDREGALMAMIDAGRFDEAMTQLAEIRATEPAAVVFTPSRIGPMFGAAFQAGDYVRALAICEAWAAGNPLAVGPYFSMVRIHTQQGDIERAKHCLQRVIDMADGTTSAERAREMLRDLD